MRGPLKFSKGWIDSQEPPHLFDMLSTAMCLQAQGGSPRWAARQPDSRPVPVPVIEMDVLFPVIKDTAVTSQNGVVSLSVRQSH